MDFYFYFLDHQMMFHDHMKGGRNEKAMTLGESDEGVGVK